MEVQLRPSRARIHPLVRPSSRRYGMGDCLPTDTACVDALIASQNQDIAEQYNDQRAGYIADCNRDWDLNFGASFAAGLPVPANTCSQKTYGLVPSGGYTGSPRETQIPVTYVQSAPPIPSPAPVPASTPVASQPASSAPSPTSAAVNSSMTPATTQTASSGGPSAGSALDSSINIGGQSFPTWAVIAGGLAVAYFMFGGKR